MPRPESNEGVPAVVYDPPTEAEYEAARTARERIFADFDVAARLSVEEKTVALGRKQERYAVAQIERLAGDAAHRLALGEDISAIEVQLEQSSRMLAEGLIKQGRFREAREYSDALYDEALALDEAAARHDEDRCECPDDVATGLPSEIVGGRQFSERHADFVYEVRCASCGFRNLTPALAPDIERLYALRRDPRNAAPDKAPDHAVLRRGRK
jgi:hypothetical protein